MIATKWAHAAPLILEARPGHTIYNEGKFQQHENLTLYLTTFRTLKVEQRFKRAWKGSDVCPPIKKIHKIIENKSFLLPYDRYKFVVINILVF